MKKTLLLTTALIGTLSVLGSAQAETKITGELKMAYKSSEGFATGARSSSGFSSERQINFSNTGTLNNGLKYATGFSLEQDGNEDGKGTSDSLNAAIDGTEGNYFNIISGNTTFTVGMDHILNGDYAIVPRAGAPMNEEITGVGGSVASNRGSTTRAGLQYNQGLGDNNEEMGVGVVQMIPSVGTIAVNYVPRSDDKANTADTAVSTAAGTSAYSMIFVGDLGVPGLQVMLERNETTKNNTEVSDEKNNGYGARYTMGNFSIGAELQKFTDVTNAETETKEIGLAYKINDKATVGIGRIQTEGKNAAGVSEASDEEIDYLQIGYNLGGFSTQLSVVNADNIAFNKDKDSTTYVFKFASKF